jgi:CheY-like chemotaxis protein
VPHNKAKALILCMGEDDSRVEVRRVLLEKDGYQVLAAADAREGLDLFVQHAIDLVLLDYETFAMNGALVAARVKAVKPQIPVLMLSAYRALPQDRLAFVDAFLSDDEPWANVLDRVDELLSPDLPFFVRWLTDWKRRRAAVTGDQSVEETPTRKMEKRSA